MMRARRATSIEDSSGIDVVVESDVGGLLLQVKSSEHGKSRFRRRPLLGIAIVVVGPADTPEALLEKVVGELEKVRAQRLEARSALAAERRSTGARPPRVAPRGRRS
jgi:hypothetical protein